ncbi:flagellar biosynthetic protein FliR [Pseudoduganella eburnea]|uniref:Flagellar biosynthetic protein FliR n=1 Tax=Massilia eburnea TaxID=1776165 RepID=A0A6L6QF91_9BURK|nr:flagellar biosynthetic protein FliR [Massilia eburnea]MTW11052.1 flagellar biosynthetic protein FliR [Massilia eburnea]
MLVVTSAELNTWIAALLWPAARILALIATSPIFGNARIPNELKIALGILTALVVSPTVPAMPALDPAGWAGLSVLAREIVIGTGMGFAMRLVFGAVEMAGEISSLTMGLGFASFFDPMSQGRSSAVSQFLVWVVTLAVLAVNAHLVLVEALAESFYTLPIAAISFRNDGFWDLALWGSKVFSAGLQLSLPIVAALLITNVALGILTRAAPQLNLFGIGFPITLGVGFLTLMMTLPYMNMPVQALVNEGIEKARQLPREWDSRSTKPPMPGKPQLEPK